MSDLLAIDTSVAVRLLVETHDQYEEMRVWARGRRLALCGHALIETYSVLTRLPGDVRVEGGSAAALIRERFERPLLLGASAAESAPGLLAAAGIRGGAAYDGLIALAAAQHDVDLATADLRALPTYARLGARTMVLPRVPPLSDVPRSA